MSAVTPMMLASIVAFSGLIGLAQAPPPTPIDLADMLGTWRSTERFEGEARITVAIRAKDRGLEGWAVLLGQHRKSDDHATLGLSFSEAGREGQLFRFNTILPEDEGTIGWELRVLSPSTAVLEAVTEDGRPMQDELKWEMAKDKP